MSGVQRRSTTPAPAPTPRWKPWRRSSRCSRNGTLTAGNSAPVTDGAAAILLMSKERAQIERRDPLAFIRAMEYGAIDPEEGTAMEESDVGDWASPKVLPQVGSLAHAGATCVAALLVAVGIQC